MIGPVSLTLAGICAGTVVLTRRSRDRLVPVLAWYIAASLTASMVVHWTQHGPSPRSTALMWLDCLGLYLVGMATVCRWQMSWWLGGLIVAAALQCAAHVVYVLGLISGDQHTLSLNILFLAQVACLLLGRTAPALDDLDSPFLEDLATA